jgi:hypothetical protein
MVHMHIMGGPVGGPQVAILTALLRPIVRFCLRHSLPASDLLEAVKRCLVSEALAASSENVSRISVATGLSRREVGRLLRGAASKKGNAGLLVRVIGRWSTEKQYRDYAGGLRSITCEGTESEFFQLVQAVSSDLNPYTVLAELKRRKLVEREGKKIALKADFFDARDDWEEGLALLARDAEDLLFAVTENVFEAPTDPNLHLQTEYTRIPTRALPRIRQWLLKEGSRFHQRAREFISRFDLDLHPATEQVTGVKQKQVVEYRVAVGTFSRVEQYSEAKDT